jgi:hypothetical protein
MPSPEESAAGHRDPNMGAVCSAPDAKHSTSKLDPKPAHRTRKALDDGGTVQKDASSAARRESASSASRSSRGAHSKMASTPATSRAVSRRMAAVAVPAHAEPPVAVNTEAWESRIIRTRDRGGSGGATSMRRAAPYISLAVEDVPRREMGRRSRVLVMDWPHCQELPTPVSDASDLPVATASVERAAPCCTQTLVVARRSQGRGRRRRAGAVSIHHSNSIRASG